MMIVDDDDCIANIFIYFLCKKMSTNINFSSNSIVTLRKRSIYFTEFSNIFLHLYLQKKKIIFQNPEVHTRCHQFRERISFRELQNTKRIWMTFHHIKFLYVHIYVLIKIPNIILYERYKKKNKNININRHYHSVLKIICYYYF